MKEANRFQMRIWDTKANRLGFVTEIFGANRKRTITYRDTTGQEYSFIQPDSCIYMQSVGLLDSKDVHLFESDIVLVDQFADGDMAHYLIVWKSGALGFQQLGGHRHFVAMHDITQAQGHDCEDGKLHSATCLGNIHENTDLLGKLA